LDAAFFERSSILEIFSTGSFSPALEENRQETFAQLLSLSDFITYLAFHLARQLLRLARSSHI
jgi:hypothetical protein